MQTSLFLARIMGPYCVIVAIGILANQNMYPKVIDGYLANAALRVIGGMLALIIGLLIVNTHNVWEGSWRVVITILGWIALLKGAWIFLLPSQFERVARAYQVNRKLININLSLVLILGVWLIVKGYF